MRPETQPPSLLSAK